MTMGSEQPRLKILVVTEGGAGVELLKRLSTTECQIVAVLTSPPGEQNPGAAPWILAEKLGYPIIPAKSVKDPKFAATIDRENVDLLLNVHSLYIINHKLLAVPRIGSFNMHPGPLPRYAGLNSPCWALYRDEREHGVTIHHMVPKIDAGPIAYQSLFPIGDRDTGRSVSIRCIREGLDLIEKLLADAARSPEAIPRIAQDLTRREYLGGEIPQGGRIDWSRPARAVFNFVRAAYYYPFPSAWGHPQTMLEAEEIGIVSVTLTDEAAGAPPGAVATSKGEGVRVACEDTWILVQKIHCQGSYVNPSEMLRDGDRLGNGQEALAQGRD
jgi:UDP-4-amino-4-deoxy-L-arabinose formyltransferase/UDP-glucuronic acid dehydrogenase (UDP-4-keto-hexauronic acid decarboxylating)